MAEEGMRRRDNARMMMETMEKRWKRYGEKENQKDDTKKKNQKEKWVEI